jgi:hypothetical protein
MIKSHSQAVLIQRVFRHVHVSSSIEITMEVSLVGIQGVVKEVRIEPHSLGIPPIVPLTRKLVGDTQPLLPTFTDGSDLKPEQTSSLNLWQRRLERNEYLLSQ